MAPPGVKLSELSALMARPGDPQPRLVFPYSWRISLKYMKSSLTSLSACAWVHARVLFMVKDSPQPCGPH